MADLKIFVSYSHADADWVERLRTHLAPLLQEEELDLWDDSKIEPGEDWQSEIRAALESSNAAILLVSPDFLASDFVREEELGPLLDAARERGKIILPIHVSPSFVERSGLGGIQAFNTPDRSLSALSKADADAILVRVAQRVAELIEASGAAPEEAREEARTDSRERLRLRLRLELADTKYKWRTIRRLAVVTGATEQEVLKILRDEDDVRLGERKKDGARIACFR